MSWLESWFVRRGRNLLGMPAERMLAPGNHITLPTCDGDLRGAWTDVYGGAGVADRSVRCEKDAAEAYAWEDKGEAAMNTANDARYVNVAGDLMTGKLDIDVAAGTVGLDLATHDSYADMRVVRNASSALDKILFLGFGAGAAGAVYMYANTTEIASAISSGFVIGAGGAPIVKVLSATATWDPGSLINGAKENKDVTVTGAAVGNVCLQPGFTSITAAGWRLTAVVRATDTVSATIENNTGGTVDLGSGTLRVAIMQF